MDLVAFLGKDRENWGQVVALLKRLDHERAILIKARGTESFPLIGRAEIIEVSSDKPLLDLKKEIISKIRERIGIGFEVSLSLASGNGKEHMALLSALLSIPVGVRLVIYTKEGVEFIN